MSARQAADLNCDPFASAYPPSGDENGATIKAIKARGVLNAGIDLNDYRWGYRGPDGKPAGFDIDLVKAMAKALLGSADKVNWVALPNAKRIPALQSGQVDVVVHTMTITCDRKQQVAFSTVYFVAGQRALVPRTGHQAGESVDQALAGRRVCVSDGSTAQDQLKQNSRGAGSVVALTTDLDCLVKLQLGQVDALLTDDAVAAGLAAQDPQTMVVGAPITQEPYGIALPLTAPDLASWVNQFLDGYRRGPWQSAYDTWLGPYLRNGAQGDTANPPPAKYGR
ncbi:glutamate ABC transporter substrate-binding protein [Streptomyces tateyamensis]|uniref:glutamate ABC transporter substrate-binding protein n=1 Tax=Streptomyces tateyamensis TaxID=565073 RepID=UPI0011B858AC|nr:glutamate ABC transporter substrate-binding protein [Streptomyces tateyamensis]